MKNSSVEIYYLTSNYFFMPTKAAQKLRDGDACTVIAGTHAGKSGSVTDINTSKTGHITITVVQKNGVRFKTLGRNVVVNALDKKSPAKTGIAKEIKTYHSSQTKSDKAICELLCEEINLNLPKAENKIWHAHPVWFLDGNPIVGYSKQKAGVRLMFWSGMGFEEDQLHPGTGKFKDASVVYTSSEQINTKDLKRWLKKSAKIQWDYKNIVKRKGKLERLK
jgi:ribosomal protein L24